MGLPFHMLYGPLHDSKTITYQMIYPKMNTILPDHLMRFVELALRGRVNGCDRTVIPKGRN